MIRVTRLNGDGFVLNADLIERIDAHPDTVIMLVDDTKYVVRETVEEVLHEIQVFRAQILAMANGISQGVPPTTPPRGVLSVVPTPGERD